MTVAITSYSFVLALHIMAVIAAFGLPLAYPLLMPYVRHNHPRAMPGLHDVQLRLNQRLTAPGTVLILLFGAHMASKDHLWGKVWVAVPVVLLLVIGAVGGAVVVPASRRMTALARADVDAAPAGGAVSWSAEYDRVYGRYMAAEIFLGACVLVAVFFMAAKPFA
jgi:uncharacterized membrane protein